MRMMCVLSLAMSAALMSQACRTPAPSASTEHSAMNDDDVTSAQVLAHKATPELVQIELSPGTHSCSMPLIVKLPALDTTQPQAQLSVKTLEKESIDYNAAVIECVHVVQGATQFIVNASESFPINAHASKLQRINVSGSDMLIAIKPGEQIEIAGNACFGWELRGDKFTQVERRSPAKLSLKPPGAWTQPVTLIDIGDTLTPPSAIPYLLGPPAMITPQRCGFHMVDTQAERVMLAAGFDEVWTLSVDPSGKARGTYKIH